MNEQDKLFRELLEKMDSMTKAMNRLTEAVHTAADAMYQDGEDYADDDLPTFLNGNQ